MEFKNAIRPLLLASAELLDQALRSDFIDENGHRLTDNQRFRDFTGAVGGTVTHCETNDEVVISRIEYDRITEQAARYEALQE